MKTYRVETVVGTIRTYLVNAESKKDIGDVLAGHGHPKAQLLNYEAIGTETIVNIKRIKTKDEEVGKEVFKSMGTHLLLRPAKEVEPVSDWWICGGHP